MAPACSPQPCYHRLSCFALGLALWLCLAPEARATIFSVTAPNSQPIQDAECTEANSSVTVQQKGAVAVPSAASSLDLDDKRIVVPLGNTGISSWRYLNPRSPFALISLAQNETLTGKTLPVAECIAVALRQTQVEFANETFDRGFDVLFNVSLPIPDPDALDLPTRRSELTTRLNRLTTERTDLLRRIQQEIAQQPAISAETRTALPELQNAPIELSLLAGQAAAYLKGIEIKDKASLNVPPRRDLAILLRQFIIIQRETLAAERIEHALNEILSPPLPRLSRNINGLIPCLSAIRTLRADVSAGFSGLTDCGLFVNDLQANGMQPTDDPAVRALDRLLTLQGVPQPNLSCRLDSGPGLLSCTYRHSVPANITQPLPLGFLGALPVGETVEFTVSLQQEVDDVITNKRGFFATGFDVKEPQTQVTWTAATSLGYSYDPDPDAKLPDPINPDPEDTATEKYSLTNPYIGNRRSHFIGVGKLGFSGRLGNRAQGDLTLTYKEGDIGRPKDDGTVKASEYTFQVFGSNGLSLRLGRFEMATPASGIAASERGEGFEFAFKNLSLGYLLKREGSDGTANDRDRDHELYLIQWKGLPLHRAEFLRSYNIFAMFGDQEHTLDEKAPPLLREPHKYWTAGIELFYALPMPSITGSAAYFWSELDPKEDPAELRRRGDGNVYLVTGSWSQIKPNDPEKKVLRKVTLLHGAGRGDDPESGREDDSYLGESAAFTGNSFFLGRLAGMIEGVSPGLANKTYAGLLFTNNTSPSWLSPLRWLAEMLNTGDQIADESIVWKAHYFDFEEEVNQAHAAGWEAGVEFSIQVPKGVRSSLEFSYFFPGDALDGILKEEPWQIKSSLKVDIK